MKYIIMALFILVFLVPSRFTVINEVDAYTIENTNNVFALIEYFSIKYGVPEGVLDYIVRNESTYNPVAVGDTHLKCHRTGEMMRSRGLVQISDCYHEVTDFEAFNPRFSLDFLARNLSEGRCSWWTTCRVLKSKFPKSLD